MGLAHEYQGKEIDQTQAISAIHADLGPTRKYAEAVVSIASYAGFRHAVTFRLLRPRPGEGVKPAWLTWLRVASTLCCFTLSRRTRRVVVASSASRQTAAIAATPR